MVWTAPPRRHQSARAWAPVAPQRRRPSMKEFIRIGVDLGKRYIQIHALESKDGRAVKRKLPRSKFLEFFADVAPCLIGMEACGSAHYWARQLRAMGHDVGLMPPAYVKAYVICGRPPMASVFWRFERFGRLRSYVRPVCAEHISAGLDEVRLPGSLSSARALRS